MKAFLEVYPRLGVPVQINWRPPVDDRASYSIRFQRPLNRDDLAALREFTTKHGSIMGIRPYLTNANSAIVTCMHADPDYSMLMWLQQQFRPYRPYTGIADMYCRLQPLIARIRVIGTRPINYAVIVAALLQNTDIDRADHKSGTRVIKVRFGNMSGEEGLTKAANVLGMQHYVGVTVLVDYMTILRW